MSNWNISILDRSVYYHTFKILSGDRSYLSCRWKSGAINWVVYPAKKSEYHVQMRRWLKWLGECHRTIGYNFLCICVCVVLWLWLSRAPDLKQGIMWWPNRKLEPTLLVAHGVAVGFRRSRSVFAAIFFWTSTCWTAWFFKNVYRTGLRTVRSSIRFRVSHSGHITMKEVTLSLPKTDLTKPRELRNPEVPNKI